MQNTPQVVPDYLFDTTKVIAWVALSVVPPFGIFSFYQGRPYLGVLASVTVLFCVLYLVSCWSGRCNRLYVSTIIPLVIILGMSLATYRLGIIGAYWSIPATLSLYFVLPEKIARMANLAFVAIIIPVAWSVLDHPLVYRFVAAFLATSMYAAIATREIKRQQDILKQQAIRDTLTGLYNRSMLQFALDQTIAVNNRTGEPMSLIMLDIDHFKQINDDLGHDAGDEVLKNISVILNSRFRSTDMAFRIGGEEFLVLVHNADGSRCLEMAEKLRAEIENHVQISGRTVTISVGVSAYQTGESRETWMKRSDENLYKAKAGGRNQVAPGT